VRICRYFSAVPGDHAPARLCAARNAPPHGRRSIGSGGRLGGVNPQHPSLVCRRKRVRVEHRRRHRRRRSHAARSPVVAGKAVFPRDDIKLLGRFLPYPGQPPPPDKESCSTSPFPRGPTGPPSVDGAAAHRFQPSRTLSGARVGLPQRTAAPPGSFIGPAGSVPRRARAPCGTGWPG